MLPDSSHAGLAAIAEETEDDDELDDDELDDEDDDELDDDEDDDELDDDEDDDEDAEGDGAAFRVRPPSTALERTPRARWPELAWQWLEDEEAHRELLAHLAQTEVAPQIAALLELSSLPEDERAVAIARLGAELSPELEAILVGSFVRENGLAGVLGAPVREPDASDDNSSPEDTESEAPGWEAIDRALARIYGDTEPHHYGTTLPYMLGGNDPLHGISVYPRVEPVPHWHFVTYGFTDLFTKETSDPEESGFGFELTFRLARAIDDEEPPAWVLGFLQTLARYVFGTGNRFAAGHKMGLNGPIAPGVDTEITAVCFANDPELDEIESELGRARFVQVVGITGDEYRLIQEWSTPGLLEILRGKLPYLVTELARRSVLEDPVIARSVEQRVAQEGSSEDLTFAGDMVLDADDGRVFLELGALYAAVLPRAMRGRLRHGRPYELRGRTSALLLRPACQNGYRREDGDLVLEITQELAREIEARLARALVGEYRFETWPALTIRVTPSFIRAPDGTATEVRGVQDPEEARAMLTEHNARIAAERDDGDDLDGDDLDGDDLDGDPDDELDGDDLYREPTFDPHQLAKALALTERALRLAPDDDDVQHTHAMLLIDAGRGLLVDRVEELIAWLPRFAPSVRLSAAIRLAHEHHPRFIDAVDLALVDRSSWPPNDVGYELLGELGDAILQHAPSKMAQLVSVLPGDVGPLSVLAWKALQHGHRDVAMALYDRVLSLPIPAEGDERTSYLRAMNNACVQAHAVKAFETAAQIADRAQPVAHENPYLFHAAACAYAAIGEYGKALEQVRLAIEHDYDHVGVLEVDADLGPLLEWPEFKALFRDWRARQERN
jgi:suppressor of fused-like protein